MDDFDMNGEAAIVTKAPRAPSAFEIAAEAERNAPVSSVVTGKAQPDGKHYTLRMIDSLASGRSNLILVLIENPKQKGSDAYQMWSLQGRIGQATVSVGEYLANAAVLISERTGHALGYARVRADLLHNLNKGFVKIA